MIDYGQFCTVARGAEVLGERWTPLVVRELLCGSTRFNEHPPRRAADVDHAAGERLRTLEEFGVVARAASTAGRRRTSSPPPARSCARS